MRRQCLDNMCVWLEGIVREYGLVSKPPFDVLGQPACPACAVIASIADKDAAHDSLLLITGFSLNNPHMHE